MGRWEEMEEKTTLFLLIVGEAAPVKPSRRHTMLRMSQGVIDENTLMWGQGLYDWLPAKNCKLLLPMIRTPEGEG